MKHKFIIGAVAVASSLSASAQINSADAQGYFQRGVAMYRDGNFNGCVDQLLHLRQLNASMAQKEDALFYIAMATQYCGDDEAIDLLNDFLIRYPQSVRCDDIRCSIGDYYFTRGNYGEALKAYNLVDSARLTSDRAADRTYRMAYSYMLLGEAANARAGFEKLFENKNYANASRFYVAYLEYWEGNYERARELFEKVNPAIQPGENSFYYLSQIYFLRGDYTKALSLAQQAQKVGSVEEFKPEINRLIGESLYHLDRTSEAIPYLQKYVDAVGDNAMPSAFYMLGVSDFEAARYNSAIASLQKATAATDAIGQSAYLYLGQCYVKEGDTNNALLAFDRAYRMDIDRQTTETALYNYTAARMDGGRVPFGNTVGMLEEFLKKYPNSSHANQVRESLVSGYMSTDDYVNALRVLEQVKNPSAAMVKAHQRALFMAGTRTYQSGAGAEAALQYFAQGSSMKGEADVTRQCLLWEGICQADLGHQSAAAEDILEYLKLAPANDTNRPLAYYTLGYIRMDQQRTADAITDFKRVVDAAGIDSEMKADALNRLGDCQYLQRNYADAAKYYNQAYDANTSAGDYALYQLAAMKAQQRDFKGAIRSLDEMMDRFASSPLVADALLAKADAYTALKRPAEAENTYEELVERFPDMAQGRQGALQLAMLKLNAGDKENAIEAYQTVVRNYPSSEEARVALDDLKSIYAEQGRLPEFVEFVNSVPNAPQIQGSQLDTMAFDTAEGRYLTDGSTTLLEKYLEQYPSGASVAKASFYLAEAAANAGNPEKAISYADVVVTRYAHSEVADDALLIKAASEAASGKGEMALESYKQLARQASSPTNLHAARMGVMTTATELSRYDDVVEVTSQLLATSASGNDEARQVRFYRALALDRSNSDRSEAENIWTELAADPSDIYGSKSAVYLAESLLQRGQVAKARKVADAFTDAGSPFDYWYARGFIALSDALRAQGHTFEADEYLENIRSNYPGDEPDIQQMIESRLKR